MSWELRGTPKTLKVTTKLAKEWSELTSAYTDRPLSERRLMAYRKMVEQAGFRPVTWAKAYCTEVKEWFRVNGKHTSTLFASIDLSKVQDLYVTIEEYTCESLDDLARLYSTFDSRLQSRSSGDVYRSFAAVIPELKDLPHRFIQDVVSGLNMWANPTSPSKDSAPEKAERLFDEVEFALWLMPLLHTNASKADVTDKGSAKPLRRAAVIGAIRATYAKNRAEAMKFWTAVRDETGAQPNLPDRKLAKYLSTMSVARGGEAGYKPARMRASDREFYVKCLHAWNAWRKGEATNLTYHPEAKLPSAV